MQFLHENHGDHRVCQTCSFVTLIQSFKVNRMLIKLKYVKYIIYINKIIKYKGGFSIRRILDTKNSRFRQVLIAFHPLFSHLPSCVNSAQHNTRINKKIIKNDDQKTVEYEVECTKARQMMYVHKKEVSFRIEFSKIRFSPNFRILSFYVPKYLLLHYTFLYLRQICTYLSLRDTFVWCRFDWSGCSRI